VEGEFRRDLYRGAAEFYDRFRPGYPAALVEDLIDRCGVRDSRVLDLGCGTGQVGFALAPSAREVWAVDQESDMVAFCVRKARSTGLPNVKVAVGRAETFAAHDHPFDLVVIGNAFHRLDRRTTATNLSRLLRPGGHLALLWADVPWRGPDPWQQVMTTAEQDWQDELGVGERVPPGWREAIEHDPHEVVLADAGFTWLGEFEFADRTEWTPHSLVGFARSMSVFAAAVDDATAAELEVDLAARMQRTGQRPPFEQTTTATYALFRR
jgi:SAM-dependent methyltransferase